jgi:hypothetical protein
VRSWPPATYSVAAASMPAPSPVREEFDINAAIISLAQFQFAILFAHLSVLLRFAILHRGCVGWAILVDTVRSCTRVYMDYAIPVWCAT